jgi:peptidyl-prolyl cis-trans isomerase A (cyclophilin A)
MIASRIKHLVSTTTLAITTFLALASFSNLANATIVQIQTSKGNVEVNLFDETTPKTVENFLNYINDNAYDDTIVHRSIAGFITQSGGYHFNPEDEIVEVTEKPAVVNEPIYSNIRGTIAMAKLGGNPNSATSQWFINLADNSANLDSQNGGFTVFGQVSEAGMLVMDSIAALPTKYFGGAFTDTPVEDTSFNRTRENTVVIDSIAITDTAVDSAANLELELNTRASNTGQIASSTSAGSIGIPFLLLLIVILQSGCRFTRRLLD